MTKNEQEITISSQKEVKEIEEFVKQEEVRQEGEEVKPEEVKEEGEVIQEDQVQLTNSPDKDQVTESTELKPKPKRNLPSLDLKNTSKNDPDRAKEQSRATYEEICNNAVNQGKMTEGRKEEILDKISQVSSN